MPYRMDIGHATKLVTVGDTSGRQEACRQMMGGYADIIMDEGNPLENIDRVADVDKNFVFIMKNGKIYKNILK